MKVKTGLGQDSHAFDCADTDKPLKLAGVTFDHIPLKGNSDADVVLHALTNAISSITGINILGERSDKLCQQGITDSAHYLQLAFDDLKEFRLQHVAISIECKTPKISPMIDAMKQSIAQLLGLSCADVGITATSGEGLTAFGRGEGIQVFAVVTATAD